MKTVFKKMLSLALVAMLLVSAVPFQASAAAPEIYDVTVNVKADDSDKVLGSFDATVEDGDKYPLANAVEANYPDYTFSHYWTEDAGTVNEGIITITGDTTIEVRVFSKDQGDDEDDAPAAGDDESADTYTVRVNVYEIKDDEAKEWGSKTVYLSKDEATLSELAAAAGYGKYETISAKINGKSVEGRAEISIDDGDQVDLFVTPQPTNNRPSNNNKPGTDSKPDTSKPSTDNNRPGRGEKVTLRVFHNDGTSDFTDITCRTTDGLLNVIENNDELSELERDGYKLIGWAFEANNDDGDWIAAQHKVSDDDDLKVFADWQETIPGKDEKPNKGDKDDDDDGDDEVLLKIYVNGNTKSAAKVVDMDAYDNDGKITLTEATKVVNKYYEAKYDDDDMDVDGLFTSKTWNDGDYSMKNAKKSIEVNEKGDTIIYVMVRDAQKISSGTADSTNPKTGDTIFVAITMMAVSATALAAVYVFNKKRAAK